MEPLTNNGSISNAIETGYKKAPCVYSTSAIFGANASGKSNFMHAILDFRWLVELSYLKNVNEQIGISAYKLSDVVKDSTFEIEFLKNQTAYRYFVELNNDEIVKEEAYYTELEEGKKEKCLFKRNLTEFNSPYGINRELAKQTIKTRLFISELVNNRNNQDQHILNIYDWFICDLHVLVNTSLLAIRLNVGDNNLDNISSFLHQADIDMKFAIKDNQLFAVQKNEKGKDVLLNLYTETSMGTKTLIIS